MATRIYGVSRGTGFDDSKAATVVVTEGIGDATAADDIELTIDLAKSLTKAEVLQKIDTLRAHIVQGIWNPA